MRPAFPPTTSPATRSTVVASATTPPGQRPRFRTQGLVTFAQLREPSDDAHLFGQDSIRELDLATGNVTELLRLPEAVLGFDWSPDGTMLAYHVHSSTGLAALCLFDTRTRRDAAPSPARRVGRQGWKPARRVSDCLVAGRNGAPRGRYVGFPSVFVVDLEGHRHQAARIGTFARWLSGERLIWQEDPRDSSKDWGWRSVSIASGNRGRLRASGKAFRPAISPDGSMIAFDDGDYAAPVGLRR
jgi:hypothetical protein